MGIIRKSSKRPVVGLELDSGHVAAVEVSKGESLEVKKGGAVLLRPGVFRDGEVTDASALEEALRELFKENDLDSRVRIGIANPRIVVRTLDLPPLADEKALEAAVKVQAPDHIPMPMEEAIVDFQRIGMVDGPAGPLTRVVIVAIRRDAVEKVVRTVQNAGLQVEGVDLSAFAMVRALGGDQETAMLYVSVGGLTNVAVASNAGCQFTRAVTYGFDAIVDELAQQCELTLVHSRQWLNHVGLITPLEEIDGEAELVQSTREVLKRGLEKISELVRESLDFYRSQNGSEPVQQGVLTGPVVSVPGAVELFSEGLGIQLTSGIIEGAQAVGGIEPGRLTVAAGLAIDGQETK